MKQTILIMLICVGLVWGCNSNKKSSHGFGKKGNTAANKPATKVSSGNAVSTETKSTNESDEPKTRLDSLLVPEEPSTSRRPGGYYGSASGPGSGGSYASQAYRHDELNQKKNAKKIALEKAKRNSQMNQVNQTEPEIQVGDTVSTEADSTNYSW